MNAIINYVNEALTELHQVRWPTRKQAIRLSIIVIGFCAVSALFFGFADYLLSEGINLLLSLTA
jgi:preprotein translocase SecE subunit